MPRGPLWLSGKLVSDKLDESNKDQLEGIA